MAIRKRKKSKRARRKINLKDKDHLSEKAAEFIAPDPDDEGDGLPRKVRRFDKFIARVRKSRHRIEKRIEAAAIKRGIDPEPLMKGVWELLLMMPRLLRLTLKLLVDRRIPVRLRLLCALSLAYVLSPIDFIPAAIVGPVGYIDDLALVLIALDTLVNEVDPAIVQEHWNGDEDVLKIIQESVSLVEWFIPTPVHEAIKKFFSKRGR